MNLEVGVLVLFLICGASLWHRFATALWFCIWLFSVSFVFVLTCWFGCLDVVYFLVGLRWLWVLSVLLCFPLWLAFRNVAGCFAVLLGLCRGV